MKTQKRLGFFTRVLDATTPAERYRLAIEQIVHAEGCGLASAWVAQHHFHEFEGGLPAPLVFLASVAARTSRIRLGTGIITLPLELPIRVAEDTSVLDMLSNHRLEVGVGPGGNLSAFNAFGYDANARAQLFNEHLAMLRTAWTGGDLRGGDQLYPPNPALADRVWQATFTVDGARRAGEAGDGLMLSRTQPRSSDAPNASLWEIQLPMVEAYLAALPPGRAPRILASRSVIVADDRAEMLRFAEIGLARQADRKGGAPSAPLAELIRSYDVHVGTAEDVTESLSKDRTFAYATDIAVQVHSVDPPHPYILRSIELFSGVVAPALGWTVAMPERRVA
jgi:putative FMN-dependent luciferase-like monooxygenase